MTLAALFILAIGLGSDAFAAAVANGAANAHPRLRDACATAAYFGTAEGLMVALGFALGAGFRGMIESVDHWVAFGLLSVIGGKMIRDGLFGGEESDPDPDPDPQPTAAPGARPAAGRMVLTAIGTSIDSAVVGITLALVGVSVALAAPLIGLTSFTMSLAGVLLGHRLGPLLGRRAEILGGAALILIGAHILIDHLSAG